MRMQLDRYAGDLLYKGSWPVDDRSLLCDLCRATRALSGSVHSVTIISSLGLIAASDYYVSKMYVGLCGFVELIVGKVQGLEGDSGFRLACHLECSCTPLCPWLVCLACAM